MDFKKYARLWGLVAGPLLGLLTFAWVPQSFMGHQGQVTLEPAAAVASGLAVWMAIWWLTEAVEIFITALLPLVVLPLAAGMAMKEVAAPYAHEIIYLFFGGFCLSLAMERTGLHRRIAVRMIAWFGTNPKRLIAGFMLTTAFLSMWISNTATALMLLPIALSLSDADENGGGFQVPLLLAIAYGASIGGVATIVGTPPNTFLVSYARDHLQMDIGFADWMIVGVPLSLVMLSAAWWLLTRGSFCTGDGGMQAVRIDEIKAQLGKPTPAELWVASIFVLTVISWVARKWLQSLVLGNFRPFAGLTDAGVAMLAAMALFCVPVERRTFQAALDWATMKRMPWGILVLFGGGLSLAQAIDHTGVGAFLGSLVSSTAGLPGFVVLIAAVVLVIFLTELTSNTATTATLVPIFAAIAPGLGFAPFGLAAPVAISASFAFMLPVATPPNAIVFASGKLSIPVMARAGWRLNWMGVAVIPILSYAILFPAFGI